MNFFHIRRTIKIVPCPVCLLKGVCSVSVFVVCLIIFCCNYVYVCDPPCKTKLLGQFFFVLFVFAYNTNTIEPMQRTHTHATQNNQRIEWPSTPNPRVSNQTKPFTTMREPTTHTHTHMEGVGGGACETESHIWWGRGTWYLFVLLHSY